MNLELRQLILRTPNPDCISLNETHLTGQNTIEFDGYTWFGKNRKTHIRARKGSGGVGFLVKNAILLQFYVILVDKCIDVPQPPLLLPNHHHLLPENQYQTKSVFLC